VVSNYEPGEDWISEYDKQRLINGAELLPPHSHPAAGNHACINSLCARIH